MFITTTYYDKGRTGREDSNIIDIIIHNNRIVFLDIVIIFSTVVSLQPQVKILSMYSWKSCMQGPKSLFTQGLEFFFILL